MLFCRPGKGRHHSKHAVSQLKQVQVAFAPVEDRLLLRISTRAGEEFRFWLTRRFTRMLWPVLLEAAGHDPAVAGQASQHAREAVLAFRHEQAASAADFAKPFEGGARSLPLGDAPLLLSRVRLRKPPGERPVLCLHPARSPGIELALDPGLLHSLTRLLSEGAGKADWGFSLELPGPPAAPGGAGQRLN